MNQSTRVFALRQIPVFFLFISFFVIGAKSSFAQDTASFKPSGKIWGYAFGDYGYKLHADSAKRGNVQYSRLPNNYNSFNFRRVYLGYDYQFSPNISSQFLLAHESSFEANPSSTNTLPDNNRAVYIKAMNIRFKNVIPRATIVAGQQSTPTFSTLSEGVWGYRSVEKTLLDMRGISSSTDLGVGVYGRIGKSENVGYDVLIGNNNGAKLENNTYKKIYTSMYAYFLDKKLVIQGNFEYDRTAAQPLHKDVYTYKAFAAYKTSKITIGIEAFRQLQTNNTAYLHGAGVPDTVFADMKPSGISFFVTRELMKDKLNLFARYDIYNPDTQTGNEHDFVKGYNSKRESFATIGLDFLVYKNVHLMPNVWYNQYHNKLNSSTGNLKNDYDLEGRMTLYFLFNK